MDKEIYDYLKNHHVPMKGDTLFKKLVTKKSSSFVLSFKMKWMEENPWLVYSKELEGGLCKFCVLFDEKDSNRGIFVKRAFQDVGKPEKIREHAEAKYHNENVTLAQNFVMSFEDPRKNVDYDPKKQERYDKNVHVLKRIIQAVALCAQQGLALRGHREVESEDNEDSLAVKVLDFQSRGPVFQTIGWLQVRLSLSSFRGR